MAVLAFDECALSILLIFIIDGIVRRKYNNRTNILLQCILWSVFISVMADLMGAHYTNMNLSDRLHCNLAYICNFVYFLTHNLILPFYVMYLYASIDMWHFLFGKKKNRILFALLVGIDTLVLLMNGWALDVFSISGNTDYHRGPWLVTFYIIAGCWIVWVIRALIRFKKIINSDKSSVLFFICVVIVLGLLIQFINGDLLVEGISMAVSVLFFMIIVKREEDQIDPISGALSYSGGVDRVSKAISSGKPISLIFVKIVNEGNLHLYLGAAEYNSFLKYNTSSLKSIARECGYTADLFYMEHGLYAFLGKADDKEKVSACAEKIREKYSEEIKYDSFTVMTNVDICVAYCPDEISDFSATLNLATSFHETYHFGRPVNYYCDMKENREYKIRSNIDAILERAISGDGLRMYYQPIYSVDEKRFVAAEALLRLKDREFGFLSPALFIPLAENTGAMHGIGEFIFNEVFNFLAEDEFSALRLKYIEMNLSPGQCADASLFDRIRELIEQKNIRPENVSFEMTESAVDMNPDIVDKNIRRLHNLGVRIALDDYGTGYSNIKRVTQLPFDQIKLDRKFVEMTADTNMNDVVKSTVEMLREMDKEILVEGVEDKAIADNFVGMGANLIQGCDLIQGFYYCKPLPKDEFIAFLKEGRGIISTE